MYLRVSSACPGRPSLAGLAWLGDPHFPEIKCRKRNFKKRQTPIFQKSISTKKKGRLPLSRNHFPPPESKRGKHKHNDNNRRQASVLFRNLYPYKALEAKAPEITAITMFFTIELPKSLQS